MKKSAVFGGILVAIVSIARVSSSAGLIVQGVDFGCLTDDNSTLWCFGGNEAGQLGIGTVVDESTPQETELGNVTGVSAGDDFTCAISNGALYCWGDNAYGQLGLGYTDSSESLPQPVVGLGANVKIVAAGGTHACAYVDDGTTPVTYCWGHNIQYQLGNNTTADSDVPVPVYGAQENVRLTALVAGHDTTCEIQESNENVFCWGDNARYQAGNPNSTNPVPYPQLVAGWVPDTTTAIALGDDVTCVVGSQNSAAGSVYCWGDLWTGTISHVPVEFWDGATDPVINISISTLENHACFVTKNGTPSYHFNMYCWGDNGLGELGDGTTTPTSNPTTPITSLAYSVVPAAGGSTTCVYRNAGGGWEWYDCWGAGWEGQLGDGGWSIEHSPVGVQGFSHGGI